MRTSSAGGPDKITTRVLQEASHIVNYPLAVIFNRSMQEGSVHQDWRNANVCPIFKKGAKDVASNFRPVSLTCIASRIMEGIIKEVMVKHLEDNEILSPSQHGFRRNKSCLTNLLEYWNQVTEALDRGHPVDIVFFDFSKAFDLVPHRRLILKLSSVGIIVRVQSWIKAWLTGRQQWVVIGGSSSVWMEALSGVPQGSVLGPLLFLINNIRDGVLGLLSIFHLCR